MLLAYQMPSNAVSTSLSFRKATSFAILPLPTTGPWFWATGLKLEGLVLGMPPSSIVTIAGMDLRRRLICSGRLRDSLASGAGPSCLASRATSAADPPSAPPAPASLLCLELCGAGVCSSFDCPPVELARAANLSHPLWCGGARASSALRPPLACRWARVTQRLLMLLANLTGAHMPGTARGNALLAQPGLTTWCANILCPHAHSLVARQIYTDPLRLDRNH
mmetsp:Transcript_31494/g.59207  ORF Transcript_31494/g.59207 Transcript_31494/m.59207 type:complete len:222 (+) Transcript_31494:1301-1966(+)